MWLALGIGTVGFGGMFATFSYISPTMTDLGGFARSTVPLILALYGVGMTAGAMLAGPVSRIGLLRGIMVALLAIAALLFAFGPAVKASQALALVVVFLLGLLPSVMVPMLQTRLMDVAHDGQALAAALNHSTLNIANALGGLDRLARAGRRSRVRVALTGRRHPGRASGSGSPPGRPPCSGASRVFDGPGRPGRREASADRGGTGAGGASAAYRRAWETVLIAVPTSVRF